MTPAQLRAYWTVVRLGSVYAAVSELGMFDAGVATHLARQKKLDDPLFTRAAAGSGFPARRAALGRPGGFSECSAGQPSM